MKKAVCKIEPIRVDFEVLDCAIKRFGRAAQTDMAIEEMSELIKALVKYKRAVILDKRGDKAKAKLTDIEDGTADVIITLAQIIMMYCKVDNVQKIIDSKINRLYKLL